MLEIKNLKNQQKIYYKSIYLYPIQMTITNLTDTTIEFDDGTYANENNLKDYFITEEECIKSCQKELEEKLEKLHLMLSKEK